MSSFHEWLINELEKCQDKIGELCPIETEIEESCTVLGTLPADLKKWFVLMSGLADEQVTANRELLEWQMSHPGFDPEHPDDARPELIGEFQEKNLKYKVICDKMKTIKAFFWTSVRHVFPDSHNYNSIQLCKDWQIVCRNEEGVMKIEVFGFGAFPDFEAPTTRGSSFLDLLLRRHS